MSKPLRLPSLLPLLVLTASLLGTLAAPARAQDSRGLAAPGRTPDNLPKGITRVTSVEGITEYRMTNRAPGELPFVWRLWFEHLRASRGRGWPRTLASFPRHLEYAFDLRRLSELPRFVVARTATRVVHGVLG